MRENAGYMIIKSQRINRTSDCEIVLGYNRKTEQFVTWECNTANGFNYYWGHYFNHELSALKDYYERILKYISEEIEEVPFILD